MLKFERACVLSAWAHWTKVWAWPRTLFTTAASLALPSWLLLRGENTADDWKRAAVALLFVPTVVFVFHLVMAPRRLWAEQKNEIDTLVTEMAERTVAKDLATRLEQAHDRGVGLLREINGYRTLDWKSQRWFTNNAAWYASVLELVREVNESERFMFKSIGRTPIVDGAVNVAEEADALSARLGKLRLITDRVYRKAHPEV